MRIVLLANGTVGLEVARYLQSRSIEIVGLGLLKEDKQREADKIVEQVGIHRDSIFDGSTLSSPSNLISLEELKPDLIICAFWAYILKEDVIKIPPLGVINLHPGYLPFCKGKNPNVWPIIEGCPGGVTIHYIDKSIDTGDIIARKEIPVSATDTAGTYYKKTLLEIVDLFRDVWPSIENKTNMRISQSDLNSSGTHHYGIEVDKLDEINLDKNYSGRELINQLRARTYGDKSFCYYRVGNKKVSIGVFLNEVPE